MKQLNQTERQLLLTLYQHKDSNRYLLTNLFSSWLSDRGIAVDLATGNLLFDSTKYTDPDSMLDVQKEIVQAILLLKYLEDNGFVYIINDNAMLQPLKRIGNEFEEETSVVMPADIADMLKRLTHRIFVAYALEHLVENDFLTDEQIQLAIAEDLLDEAHHQTRKARRTLGWAVATFAVAVVAMAAQLSIPAYRYATDDHHVALELLNNINSNIESATVIVADKLDTHSDIGQAVLMKTDHALDLLQKQDKTLRRIQKGVDNMAEPADR